MRSPLWMRDEAAEEQQVVSDAPRGTMGVPAFALVVSESATDGWHVAALVREHQHFDYYARAIAVRWPLVIARPAKSLGQSHKWQDESTFSPAATLPARKLVVNWGWDQIDDDAAHLRFYVKRTRALLSRGRRPFSLRVTLRQISPSPRRIVVTVTSNPINWRSA
jgi:hypothetical protein